MGFDYDMITVEPVKLPLKRAFVSAEHGIVLDPKVPDADYLQLHVEMADNLEIPLRQYLDKSRIETALSQVAAYMELCESIIKSPYLLGITHQSMAKIAVRHFGFTPVEIPIDIIDTDYVNAMKYDYDSMPHVVLFNRDDFMSRYGGAPPQPETVNAALIQMRWASAINYLERELPF